jgi:hypothetical protein
VPLLKRTQLPILDEWLRSILWDLKIPKTNPNSACDTPRTFEVHRLKARLPVDDGTVKIVQGVREIFEIIDAPQVTKVRNASCERGKLVFVGRNIAGVAFEESYLRVINSPSGLQL